MVYEKNRPFQFVEMTYGRQDFPEAFSHHHYICGFNIKYLNKLNNELIFKNTFPIFLNNDTSRKLIEVDTYEELKKFKKYNLWKPKITNSNKLFSKAIKIIPGGSQTLVV